MPDRLAGVHPMLIAKITRILQAMALLGSPMLITDGIRTLGDQRKLYAQGRTAPGRIVTQIDGVTKKSQHQLGRAVDCTFIDGNGRPRWVDSDPWMLYGAMVRSQGLAWGGDWRTFKDRPHVEMKKGDL